MERPNVESAHTCSAIRSWQTATKRLDARSSSNRKAANSTCREKSHICSEMHCTSELSMAIVSSEILKTKISASSRRSHKRKVVR